MNNKSVTKEMLSKESIEKMTQGFNKPLSAIDPKMLAWLQGPKKKKTSTKVGAQ